MKSIKKYMSYLSSDRPHRRRGRTGARIEHRGGEPALQSLLAGRLDYSCNFVASETEKWAALIKAAHIGTE